MPPRPLLTRLAALLRHRPEISTARLALAASLFASVACNNRLWSELMLPQYSAAGGNAGFMAAMFVLVTTLQFILFSLLLNRWTAKPVLALLSFLTAGTVYFMDRYGIYMDTAMAHNLLQTDLREVRDLLHWDMLPYLGFYAVLPWLALWRIRIKRPPVGRLWLMRPLALGLALVVTGCTFYPISGQLMPLFRENKHLRYLITPGNVVFSLLQATVLDRPVRTGPREALAPDAALPPRAPGEKPLLLVLVIGETTRAANWGLNGYARQTTPQLAARDVINYPRVTSCGTNTATSLPCMFSGMTRENYDAREARSRESLLNVLQRTGIRVLWRENQSGCKGVCDGVEEQILSTRADPALCRDGECFDEILLRDLEAQLRPAVDRVVVLHLMGLHGPAYYRRYPPAFRRFTPTCDTSRLADCSRAQIVNTYDNGVLYTDHVVAQTIDLLKQREQAYRTALIYVSDHGESLGENGIYLHSIPWAIAPAVQKEVPMVLWTGNGLGMDQTCLQQRSAQPASHDHLFHTVLGLTGVRTGLYNPGLDLTAGCAAAH